MAKKAKPTDHNTSNGDLTKSGYCYKDILFMRQVPIQEEYIDRLCEDWKQWAKLETSLRIRQFWNERGISITCVYRWMKEWPQLQETHDYVLDVLADRRDIGALTRKLDGAQVRETFALYDPDFKAYLQWRASLTKKEDTEGGITTVEIPVFIEREAK